MNILRAIKSKVKLKTSLKFTAVSNEYVLMYSTYPTCFYGILFILNFRFPFVMNQIHYSFPFRFPFFLQNQSNNNINNKSSFHFK